MNSLFDPIKIGDIALANRIGCARGTVRTHLLRFIETRR